jgi:ABC-type multidrug transport system fused ATPase/permease subunit
MIRFALRLVRPHWKWLLIVVATMLLDTAMGLASRWPLKIVLDSVFGTTPLPAGFAWMAGPDADRLARLNVAVAATVVIALLDIVIDLLTIVGMLVVMFSLNWRFTVVALAVTPLLAVFVFRLRSVIRQATRDVRQRQREIVTIVQEGLGAIRVVKAFAQGAFERQRLEAKSVESVEAALYARRVRSLLGPTVTSLVAIGTAAVLWFGARQVLEGAMTAGALVVFLTYLGKLFRPIQDLARASTTIAQATVGLERVKAVLDADEPLPRAAHPRTLERVDGRVEFRNVTFGYDAARPVLSDLSFVVEPGQLVGLVGPSGSGKSTLVSLVPRFYDVGSGAVTIDGIDVRELSIRSLRRQVGFVLQETQLFHAPIWQNISSNAGAMTSWSSGPASTRSCSALV